MPFICRWIIYFQSRNQIEKFQISKIMSSSECPKCKTTSINDPNLVLRINICGCILCTKCEADVFKRGQVAKCYKCQYTYEKRNFRNLVFDDPLVDKEIFFRAMLQNIFNRTEEDFQNQNQNVNGNVNNKFSDQSSDTKETYEDYQEMIEDYVYILTNNHQNSDVVKNVYAKIQNYKKANDKEIEKNKLRNKKAQKAMKEKIQMIERYEQKLRLQYEEEDRRRYEEKLSKVHTSGAAVDNNNNQNQEQNTEEDPINDMIPESSDPRQTFRAFRFTNNKNNLILPEAREWPDFQTSTKKLNLNPGSIQAKSDEDIISIGYLDYVKKQEPWIYENVSNLSMDSPDMVGVIQRRITEAFNCM